MGLSSKSWEAVQAADKIVSVTTMPIITISEFANLWERFLTLPTPLHLHNVEHGKIVRRVFRTLCFSGDSNPGASKEFSKDLETEIYSLIALHKSMQDKYASKYTWAVYQFSRGVQSLYQKGDTLRWYQLIQQTVSLLETMAE